MGRGTGRRWAPTRLMLCIALLCGAAALGPPGPAAVAVAGSRLQERVQFGAWVPGTRTDPAAVDRRQALLRTPLRVASVYRGYGDWFPTQTERRLVGDNRRRVLIAWDMGPHRFASYSAGAHDDYLRTIGRLAARYRTPVYVRPWPEMNGDWQSFQPTHSGAKPYGGTPQQFVAAWRHVVRTVRRAGGTNIRWVFNPYAATYRGTTRIPSIWPGAAYVDVLGMDGFNWGTGNGPWLTFAQVFGPMYRILSRLHPTMPIWICEVGSTEVAPPNLPDSVVVRSKADWVEDMFAQSGFRRVKVIVWFDERKERDWRVNSSRASLAAFRRALAG